MNSSDGSAGGVFFVDPVSDELIWGLKINRFLGNTAADFTSDEGPAKERKWTELGKF